jgi:ribonuclease Z
VELTFLGTGAGNFRGSRRRMPAAFVEGILLDCGAGTTGMLHDAALFDRVDAVLLSHLHTDHLAGLFDLLLHTLITGRTRPLVVVAPPGLSPILAAMNRVHAMVQDPAERFDFRLVEGLRPELAVGRWQIRGIPLHHTIDNLGYHLRSDSGSVFYTGDTRPPSAPDGLRADFVIHESTYADRDAAVAREYGHSTSSEAARAGRAMGARRLFLTHIGDRPDAEVEIRREARALFPDSVVADDAARYDL